MKKTVTILLFWIFFYFLFIQYTSAQMTPIGFSGNDANYVLEGKADMFFVDEQWRQSGYKNGHSIEEIPWVWTHIMIWWDNSNRKEIYMSERKDLKLVVVWNTNESYTLLIAWWNYYLKLEGIETNEWQIDEISSKEDSIEIDFDDDKQWDYNLMMNFYKYKNWSIYYSAVRSTWDYQRYLIDWEWVDNRVPNSVKYTVEKDTDWVENKYNIIFDEDKFWIPDIKTNNSRNYLLYWIIIISFITLILLFLFLYKKKISRKQFLILFSSLIVVLLFWLYSYYEDYEKIICSETKEPWIEYSSEWMMWSYEIKDNKVYIRDYIWSTLDYDLRDTNIDAKTFKLVSGWYTRDSWNIYFRWKKVDNVDLCSFEVSPFSDSRGYSQWFARDMNYVFYRWRVLKKTDVKTFTKIWPFFKDKNYVYNSYGETLDSLDVNTFVYNSEKYFSYDKNWVYVNEEIMIKWADWESFKKIGWWYLYKDKNNVYYKTEIIVLADSETFEEISYEYYKDKNYIYKSNWQILEWADSKTFSKYWKFYYDKNWIYPEKWFFIPWAEIKNFKDLWGWYYIDNKNAYYINKYFNWWDYAYTLHIIKDINIESFLKLSNNWYAKDDKNVYYLWLIVEGVDVESFSILWISYTKDKNNVYFKWKIIEKADPNTFKYFWWKLSVDRNNAYSQWKIIEDVEPSMCTNWKECNTNYPQKKSFFD